MTWAAGTLGANPEGSGGKGGATVPEDVAVIVMAKVPAPGQVKTRLSPPLSPAQAAELAAAFLIDTWHHAHQAVGESARLAVAGRVDDMPVALPRGAMMTQQGACLGRRMMNAAASTLERARRVVIIGSDLPLLSAASIRDLCNEASALANDEISFCPSDDGGFSALGLASAPLALFDRIHWSAPTTMKECIDTALAAGFGIRFHRAHDDIDDLAGLLRLKETLAHNPALAPVTAAYLAEQSWA